MDCLFASKIRISGNCVLSEYLSKVFELKITSRIVETEHLYPRYF
jgi:hypothetical protein